MTENRDKKESTFFESDYKDGMDFQEMARRCVYRATISASEGNKEAFILGMFMAEGLLSPTLFKSDKDGLSKYEKGLKDFKEKVLQVGDDELLEETQKFALAFEKLKLLANHFDETGVHYKRGRF